MKGLVLGHPEVEPHRVMRASTGTLDETEQPWPNTGWKDDHWGTTATSTPTLSLYRSLGNPGKAPNLGKIILIDLT